MKKKMMIVLSIAAILSFAALSTGCGSSASILSGTAAESAATASASSAAAASEENTADSTVGTSSDASDSASQASSSADTSDASSADASASSESDTKDGVSVSSIDGLLDSDTLFTERDLTQTADTSDAVSYTVQDGQDITITEEGVYVISGTASDCSIIVNAADDAKVQIVLDGLSITNTDTPAIYVVNADKCFVTTAEGSSNTLSVTGTFTTDGETNTDAVIFSKADLVMNGTGTLTISSTGNGITSKDDLKVTGGTYDITAAKNGLEGKDSISVSGGSFTINAKDGLHSENSDDNTLGAIYICGGTFDITASDDGIHGTTAVQIDGGEFTIDAVEGIEATYVQINDGTISINASDDGINAAAKSTVYDPTVELNGGTITIVMGSGDTDAVDANGSIIVNGGNINITGNSSFDYDTTGELNGGTVIVNGSQITEMPAQMMGGGGGMKGGMGTRG